MKLVLDLNKQQSGVIKEMHASGLRGQTIEDVAIRMLDAAFIDYETMTKMPAEPEEKEPWQREDD